MIKPLDSTLDEVQSLAKSGFQTLRAIYRPTETAKQRKNSRSNEWRCYGYFVEGSLAAVVEANYDKENIELSSLAVAPEYRKQGIATALINLLTVVYPEAKAISLWCVEQTGNVAIFAAMGFTVVSRVESELFEMVDGSQAIEVQLSKRVYKKPGQDSPGLVTSQY